MYSGNRRRASCHPLLLKAINAAADARLIVKRNHQIEGTVNAQWVKDKLLKLACKRRVPAQNWVHRRSIAVNRCSAQPSAADRYYAVAKHPS